MARRAPRVPARGPLGRFLKRPRVSRITTRTVDVRTVTRRANSRRRKVHTAAFDRCVRAVTGRARNPFAVCEASLGARAELKPRRRRGNPRPGSGRRGAWIIVAAHGAKRLGFAGDRFTAGAAPVKFPTRGFAAQWARHLKRHYADKLRRWRLRVLPA